MKILVSKCLLGERCRFDGRSKANQKVLDFLKDHEIIPVCPEVMGGMQIPHTPCERIDDKVMGKDGNDYTDKFQNGAKIALDLCLANDCHYAILKAKSPSCGHDYIYDGNFNGTLIKGHGCLTEKLLKHDIKIYNEDEIEQLIKDIESL